MLDFSGRVAIVTGAGRGLGRAHALTLASRGARVLLNDLAAEGEGEQGPAHTVLHEIREAGGDAAICEGSVTDCAPALVDAAIDAFGRLDIVINNAGIFDPRPFGDFSVEEWPRQVEVHLLGGTRLLQAAWPHLQKSGSGRVINTISSGIYGNSMLTGYAAAKAGLLGVSRSLAYDGEPFGITVNCVFPGAATRMQAHIDDSLQPFLKKHFQPEYVAAFAAWLVHQDTTVNGEMFEVGGGVTARVRFAHHPFVKPSDNTPEAWAEIADQVLSDESLVPLSTTLEMAIRQFNAIEPGFASSLDDILTQ
jgi:NAD(P)-dependent dehydrogenase (short-subunit alcohol dehydrogenase family)